MIARTHRTDPSDASPVEEYLEDRQLVLSVTPLDTASFADTMRRALDANPVRRRHQYERLESIVSAGGPNDWIERCLAPLAGETHRGQYFDVARTAD